MEKQVISRPVNPRNGAKYKDKDGNVCVFRNGSWINQKKKK